MSQTSSQREVRFLKNRRARDAARLLRRGRRRRSEGIRAIGIVSALISKGESPVRVFASGRYTFRRLRRSLKRRMENGGTGCRMNYLIRAREQPRRASNQIKWGIALARSAPHAFAICVSRPFIADALSRVKRGLIVSAYRSRHYALLRLSPTFPSHF